MRLCEITLGDWVNLEKVGPQKIDGKTYINLLQILRFPKKGVTEDDFLLGLVPIDIITDIPITKENLKKFGFGTGTLQIGRVKVKYLEPGEIQILSSFGEVSYQGVRSIRDIQNKLRENGFFEEAASFSLYI